MFAFLQFIGIPYKIVSAIRVIYDQSTGQVYIQDIKNSSRTAIRTICYYHKSETRWCTSTISIHYRDRLCLQKICWRFRLSHSQREQPIVKEQFVAVNTSDLTLDRIVSSQVTVSACRHTNPPTNLSFINQRSNQLVDYEHKGRHNSIKFRRTFYNLAKNLSKQEG